MTPRLFVILAALMAVVLGSEAFSSGFVASFSTRSLRDTIGSSNLMKMRARAVAKRGKVPSPPRLRHDYSHRADERDWNSDTFEDHRVGEKGAPALNLFVRGHHSHSDWMHCGNMVLDETTVHLINYYRDTSSETARRELDDIVAKSLAGAWEANTVIDEGLFSVYPFLRRKQSELEFGYRISHEDMSEEQQKIHILALGSGLRP